MNLLDNDVVHKVLLYAVEDSFLRCCTIPGGVYVLPTLKHKFHLNNPSKALKYFKTEDCLQRFQGFLSNVCEIQEVPEVANLLEKFVEVHEIDSGEALLFAMAAFTDESLVFTGDKRAIKALTSIPDPVFIETIRGRIKCLEQCFAEMLIQGSICDVIGLVQGRSWDTTLRIVFSSSNKDGILQGLNSYYSDLNAQCGGLLMPFPSC